MDDHFESEETIREAIKQLESSNAMIHKNVNVEVKQVQDSSRYEYLQVICIVRYLIRRLKGETSLRSATAIADIVYGKTKLGSYKSRCYLKTIPICKSRQGKHRKTQSIILDAIVKL